METTEVTNTEVETTTQDTTTIPEAATTTPVETTAKETATAATTTKTAPTVYTPNFKFKVKDEEKEFDEWVKPWLKDSDTEAKIRDLYTKAHGLEPLKTRLSSEVDTWKSKANEATEKYGKVSESLQQLSHFVQTNDFDSFFDALKIQPQKVYQWVNRKIQEQEMAPEQRAELESQRQERHRLYLLEKQNQELQTRLESYNVEQSQTQLTNVLSSPDVASVAQAFDAKVGQPGAFKNEVIKHGVALYAQHGRDYPADYVVQDLLKTFGKVIDTGATTAMGAVTSATSTSVQTKPPVIPNVQSRGGSPVKQAPRTLEELRKIATQMQ